MRSGKVEVLFNTNPVEFTEHSVLLDVQGQKRELPNDFVWIFAGGMPPYDFLKKIGIRFGMRDQTQEASGEAKRAAQEKQLLAKAGAGTACKGSDRLQRRKTRLQFQNDGVTKTTCLSF